MQLHALLRQPSQDYQVPLQMAAGRSALRLQAPAPVRRPPEPLNRICRWGGEGGRKEEYGTGARFGKTVF